MPPVRRTVAGLLNVRSRLGMRWASGAKEELEKLGVDVTEWSPYKRVEPLVARAEELAQAGAPLVLVAGGDGTIGAVAKVMAESETVLAILPFGTGNAFAHDLGLNGGLAQACDTVVNGRVEKVDIGAVEDRRFVNVVTAGLSTLIARSLDPVAKRRFGKWAYVFATLAALGKARPFGIKLTVDGEVRESTSMQIVVGNGRYHGGPFVLGPHASLKSGKLAGYSLRATRRSELLRFALLLRKGWHVAVPEVDAFECANCRIETSPVQRVTADGETWLATPVECSIMPGALKVLVPQTALLEPD